MSDTPPDSNTYTQIRVDIGELKGILTTVVTEHGRRIQDAETEQKQFRTDLTNVKEKAAENVTEVSTRVTSNTEHIRDIRGDVQTINDKMNGSVNRAIQILSPLIATAAFGYAIYRGGR